VQQDAESQVAHRPWPPAFSADLVAATRARLHDRGVLLIAGADGASRDLLAAEVAGLLDRPSRHRHVARRAETHRPRFVLEQLWRGEDLPADQGLDAVEALIRERLSTHAGPPCIVLADAELADEQSIEVLVRLAESGDLRLVATVDASPPTVTGRLRDAGDLLEIAPMDAADVASRLEERFGAMPDPAVVAFVQARAAGSYELVRRFVDSSVAAGLIGVRDGVLLPTDPSVDAVARIAAVAAPAGEPLLADLLDVVSLLGELDVAECSDLFGDDALDLAVRRGVLSMAGDSVGFVFSVEATSIRRGLSRERQADLFDRYAAALTRSAARPGVAPRVADWWTTSGRLLPVDLARRATREANLQARFRRALVHSDPAANEQQCRVAVSERVYAQVQLGDRRDAVDLFAGVDPATLDEDDLYVYLNALHAVDDPDERQRLADRAVAVDDPAARRRREAVRVLADLVRQTFDGSGDRVASRLRALTFSGQLSTGNRALTFTALSAALRSSARPTQAVQAAEFAIESLLADSDSPHAFHLDPAGEVLISARVSALDLDGAQQAVDAYASGPFGTGGGRLMLPMRAFVRMQRGLLGEALDDAHLFLNDIGPHDPHQLRGWVEAMAADCLVHLGRPDEAEAALESAARHHSGMPETDLGRRIAMAASRDALAEPEEALEILGDVIDEATDRGLLDTRIHAAAVSVLVGGPPQLPRLLDAVGELVEPTGAPEAWQRFAQGVQAYDIPAIVELAIDLEARHARLMASGIAQFVLDMARRATDLDDRTRAHLATLADLADPPRG
jgi:tetratricopeptide (TPR) repeat protein